MYLSNNLILKDYLKLNSKDAPFQEVILLSKQMKKLISNKYLMIFYVSYNDFPSNY